MTHTYYTKALRADPDTYLLHYVHDWLWQEYAIPLKYNVTPILFCKISDNKANLKYASYPW